MPDTPDVQDANINIGINSCFRTAVKSYNKKIYIAYLESCKHVDVSPAGLVIDKSTFISFLSNELTHTVGRYASINSV